MGSYFKRGKRYVVKFRDATGRLQQRRLKVRTATEAERILKELEGRIERQRLGLEDAPPPPMLFKEISKAWLDEHSSTTQSHASNEARVTTHLLPTLGELLMSQVTPQVISRLLARKAEDLGDWSVFHLRKHLVSIFNWALRMKLYRGDNSAALVPKPEIQSKTIRFLEAAVIPSVLGSWSAISR